MLEPSDPAGSAEDLVATEVELRPNGPGADPGTAIVGVDGPEALARAGERLRSGEPLAIRWVGERVLPLETLVADAARRGALWVFADGPAQVPAALGALEHGADQVVVEVRDEHELAELEALLEAPEPVTLDWREAPIVRAEPAGMGDRVIVDTTSLLLPSEGLLVGSAAEFLFHLRSEAEGSRYTRPRPFRVNAGSAHSYVLLANGETRYLAELGAGDPLLVTRPRGDARTVRVGRLKIERRPLTLVEVRVGDRARTLFVQEAETVRLTTAERAPAPATALGPGTALLGVRMPPGRHLGRPVVEAIEER